jgi:hypothetical protein
MATHSYVPATVGVNELEVAVAGGADSWPVEESAGGPLQPPGPNSRNVPLPVGAGAPGAAVTVALSEIGVPAATGPAGEGVVLIEGVAAPTSTGSARQPDVTGL